MFRWFIIILLLCPAVVLAQPDPHASHTTIAQYKVKDIIQAILNKRAQAYTNKNIDVLMSSYATDFHAVTSTGLLDKDQVKKNISGFMQKVDYFQEVRFTIDSDVVINQRNATVTVVEFYIWNVPHSQTESKPTLLPSTAEHRVIQTWRQGSSGWLIVETQDIAASTHMPANITSDPSNSNGL